MLSSNICRKHSTEQHSAISPARSRKPSTCRSDRDNASKQTGLAKAGTSSSIFAPRCVLKAGQEIEIGPAYNNMEALKKQLRWRDARRICLCFQSKEHKTQHCFFSVSFLCFSCVHAASGVFSWSVELLASSSYHFAPKFVDLSVRVIRSLFHSSL